MQKYPTHDVFVFGDPDDDVERSACYGPGGLFPVKLGDMLDPESSTIPPRYRIAAKLGRGSSSTVWMVRDSVEKNMATVKLVQASDSTTSMEAAILEHLRAPSVDSEAPPVLQLRDSFKLRTPAETSEDPNLHPSNIGVAVSELDAFTEIDIWNSVGSPYVAPVVTYDPDHDPASFPPYITHSLDLGDFLRLFAPSFLVREPLICVLVN
ncbi:hypothetical protein C8R44DRAFT_869063 [Mycena epipterygia]|nr:hypothetical protein C8R44DRAFT_869063 [Mycena epipterygia]